jgi:multicomponent Na+:H+ antiporter subunit A
MAILLPFLFAIFIPILYKYFRSIHTGWFVLVLPILLFTYFFQFMGEETTNHGILKAIPWIPSLGINFSIYLDGLSLLFSLLITGIGALVVLYSIYYLSIKHEALNNFYVYLMLFMGAMLGVVLSDNLLVLYTFWELTSLSSFLLIAYWYKREKSRYGAQKSMIITIFGGLSMLGGFLLLYLISGTFSVRELISQVSVINGHELFVPALILVLLGAFTKSAQFPFYIWLPDAMEAPTPVSAYLHSATMVKAGIYLVARLTPVFAIKAEWFWIVSAIGLITLFWAAFNAIKQTDLKSILAFSTVSQLGLIMSLLGVGSAAVHYEHLDDNIYMAATVAAIFHLINHATFKGSLFMVTGIVDHETGTRDIRKLGGLISFMPVSFTIAAIGSFSMAGIPPFNGFLSKEMFLTAMVHASNMEIFSMKTWGILFPVLGWVASVFTFIYSMVFVFKTFTGKYQPEKLDTKPHEAPLGMLISPLILALLVIILGLFPNLLANNLIQPATAAILPSLFDNGHEFHVHIMFWHGFTIEVKMTIGIILFGVVLYLTLRKWDKFYKIFPKRLVLNHFYDSGMIFFERFTNRLMTRLMNGSLQSYLVYMFSFIIIAVGGTLISLDAFTVDLSNVGPIRTFEVILTIVMAVATVITVRATSRLTAIIGLGTVGYSLSLFFVLFRAPDLALTQLIVETISVALFLLCFYFLPDLKDEKDRPSFKLAKLIISAGVGILVTLLALSSHSTRLFDSISHYFVEASYEEAGGKNMVNVILVDFRGIDTLFEITVLGIAAIGIYSLIKLRLAGRNEG